MVPFVQGWSPAAPYAVALMVAGLLCTSLAVTGWRRRTKPGGPYLALMMAAAAIWSLFYAFELLAPALAGKVAWAKLEYVGIVTVPVAWFLFVRSYTGTVKRMGRRLLALLGLIPLITLVLVATNEFHGLIWADTSLGDSGPFPALVVPHGPWFWVHVLYSYCLLAAGSFLLVWTVLRYPRAYKTQTAMLMTATAAPWVGNVLWVFGIHPAGTVDLTPFAFAITGSALLLSTYRLRLFSLLPGLLTTARNQLLQEMSDGVLVVDVDGLVVTANPAVATMLEKPESDLVGRPVCGILGEEVCLRLAAADEVGEARFEISMQQDSSRRSYDVVLSTVHPRTNVDMGRLLVMRDITEQKDVGEALAKSEEESRAILQQFAEGFFLIGENGLITEWNRAMEEISGLARAEAVGRAAWEVQNQIAAPGPRPPEAVEGAKTAVLEALRSGEAAFISRPAEGSIVRRDGEKRDILQITFPVRTGSSMSLGCVIQDVTERKQMEESLRLTRLSVEAAGDGVVWLDSEGSVTFVNDSFCTRLGYSRDELLEMTVFDLTVGLETKEWARRWSELKEQGPLTFERFYRTRDGDVFPVEITAAILEHEGHELNHSYVRDITERRKIEEALRLTRFSVDRVADCVHWVAPDGRIVDVNESSCRKLGYSREEMLSLTVWDLNPFLPPEGWPERWREIKEQGSFTLETELRTRDGEMLPVEIAANYVEHDGREFNVAFVRDVSERKRAEEALRRSEERYRVLVDTTSDMIFSFDREMHLTGINRSAADSLGLSTQASLGTRIADLGLPEAMRRRLELECTEAMAAGQAAERLVCEFTMSDGETHDIEIDLRPIGSDEGPVLGVRVAARDVTERRQFERSLEAAKDYAENLLETANAMVVGLDLKGRVTVFNREAERVTGYARSEILGRNWFELVVPRDRFPEVWEVFECAPSGDLPRNFENPILTKTGEERHIFWQNNVLREGDDVSGTISFGIDITERKQIEESLNRTQFAVDHWEDFVLWVDSDSRFLYVNESSCRRLGYSREEMLGMNVYDIDPEAPRPWSRHFEEIRERRSFTLESRHRTKGGEFFPVEVTVNYVNYGGKEYCCASARDISARKEVEEALRESERRYRDLVDYAHDLIFTLDAHGRFLTVNSAVERVTGYSKGELIGRSLDDLAKDWEMPPGSGPFSDRNGGQSRELRLVSRSGANIVLDMNVRTVLENGEVVGCECIARDVTESHLWEEALKFQVLHDGLTGLPNRTYFRERLEELVASERRDGSLLAVYFLDLDNFKVINDSRGHHCGDVLLRQVAARLETAVPSADTVARLGGDEFAALVPVESIDDARRVALWILDVFHLPVEAEEEELELSASIGVSLFPTQASNVESLLRFADIAMYDAKRAGGGRYALYEFAESRHSLDRSLLQRALRKAFARQEFVLHYQPLVNITTGRVVGVEALTRWNHPQRGLIGPSQFLDSLEQEGLADRLADWVLRTALAQCSRWRSAGLEARVSVNLSARNLDNPGLFDLVVDLCKEHHVDPGWLTLELTETSILLDPPGSVLTLAALHELGARVAVDDFGSGHAGLAYLKKLPVDEVKIDRSFILTMAVDKHDAAIVRSVIALGRDLGLTVVAEGVENKGTADLLSALGCDVAQGYYYARPMPAALVAKRLQASPQTGTQRSSRRGVPAKKASGVS